MEDHIIKVNIIFITAAHMSILAKISTDVHCDMDAHGSDGFSIKNLLNTKLINKALKHTNWSTWETR